MQINSVTDPIFREYGAVMDGYAVQQLLAAMADIPLPDSGTAYQPSVATLEACDIFGSLRDNLFGGMPIQLGMCWGRNTKLNCLEYHRDSEVNIGTHDFVLLLAKREEIQDGKLDTAKVRAFRVPAGVMVEVYATALHYAPCHVNKSDGFRVAVVLPRGTNTGKPTMQPKNPEDLRLFARNKWLLAHADAPEAREGAYIGLVGQNLDIANEI